MENTTPAAAPQPLLCVVNRHQGYPVVSPRFKLYEVCELPDNEQTRKDIGRGLLIEASPENPLFTEDLARRVVDFRKRQSELAATVQTSALKAPTPEEDAAARQTAEAIVQKAENDRRQAVQAILGGAAVSPVSSTPVTAPATTSTAGADLSSGSTSTNDQQQSGEQAPGATDAVPPSRKQR